MSFEGRELADYANTYAMPNYLIVADVKVWGTFVAADEKLVATSLYLGTVTMI